MNKVLFICVRSSVRSEMAEAFFNHLAQGKESSISAGFRPASPTDHNLIQAIQEAGINISHQCPKQLTLEMLERADHVVTMDCEVEEACLASFVPTEDWELKAPEGKLIEKFGQIENEIKRRVKELVKEFQ